MHILFLSDNFPPEVNAPASRTFEHCREWVKLGAKVTVITTAPNFPSGKLLAGYKNRLWQAEMMEGIRVIRVWSYITANEGFLRRTLDYVSFMLSGTLTALPVRGVDIVVGTSPQFFTVCAARAVSAIKRVPFVFELRDIWPESIRAVGAMRDGVALRMLERLELYLYRKADAIVCVTHSFKRALSARGVDAAKISVVLNGADLSRFTPREKDAELVRRLGLEGKLVAGYIGTHGMAHGLETILEAARLMKATPYAERIRFLMLGDGARKKVLVGLAQSMGLDNVIFHDSVGKDDVVRFWSVLDTTIIHLKRSELFTTVIPSKIFEAMAMGLPMICGLDGESADLVTDEGAGVRFEPEDAAGLRDVLIKLAGDPSLLAEMRGRCLSAAPGYDRGAQAVKMLDVLNGVVRRGEPSARA